jgi:hypothetical protein
MKKKILAGLASFTLATALVIAPSIVGGGSSANAASEKLANGVNVSSFSVKLGSKTCSVSKIAFRTAYNNNCNDMQAFASFSNGWTSWGNYVKTKKTTSLVSCYTNELPGKMTSYGANAILRA